ncbi:hypothetical protein EW146_g8030 [Bondarzewia mesenterica]|uniref:Uncharacterized protein n=1 Tax=Bondarzewia mesenterica TaxID=1095465 RepID=A0A4S4LHK7_9AGAM|nr:hypothetical protein EW146_g8030 [Bondarzewia mesenterica]
MVRMPRGLRSDQNHEGEIVKGKARDVRTGYYRTLSIFRLSIHSIGLHSPVSALLYRSVLFSTLVLLSFSSRTTVFSNRVPSTRISSLASHFEPALPITLLFTMTPEDEKEFLSECIAIAKRSSAGSPLSPTTTPPLGSDSYSEAHSDYHGFPSNPVSIYHTGDPWPRSTGPEAQRVPKEARPICNHPIAHVWCKLGRQIYEYFDSVGLRWTSIDPVCFAEVGKEAGPPFLWVGVMPRTLSREDAENAAVCCKQILAESQITTSR